MKKIISSILCTTLVFSLLCGCGATKENSDAQAGNDTQAAAETTEATDSLPAGLDKAGMPQMSQGIDLASNFTQNFSKDASASTSTSTVEGVKSLDNVDYVMIYNPLLFNEKEEDTTLSSLNTGDFSSQITIGTGRADGPDLEFEQLTLPTGNLDGLDYQHGGRAAGIVDVYEEGDTSDFYYDVSIVNNLRDEGEFTCEYAGEYCYIWSIDGSVSADKAKECGEQFDENIYEKDVETFGEARFTEDGGKINLLFFPMDLDGVCGFFSIFDIFSYNELPADYAKTRMINTDRAIININSDRIGQIEDEQLYSTMSHEFQHLICATEALENGSDAATTMASWLNEAMSAYAEELIYPGIKEVGLYNVLFYPSANFKKGQSLYNFSTENDEYIGAYSAVYLFEEYLRRESGDDVFSKVHSYWRTADLDITEANALSQSVSKDFYDKISKSVTYPENISDYFTDSEEWMSKLTLNFYLETLSSKLGNLQNYEPDARTYMMYDELSAADIEGGGRIIVATQNQSYTIPDDAADELIYVGLDKDFNVVTDVITKGNVEGGSSSAASGNSAETKDDTEGFEFIWNGNLDSYIYIPSSDFSNFAGTYDETLQAIGGNASKIVTKSTLAEMASDVDKNVSDSKVGFLTIVLPAEVTDDEIVDIATKTLILTSKGVYVTIVANTYIPCIEQYCVLAFSDKLGEADYKDSVSEYTSGIIALSFNTLFDVVEGKTNPPAYGMFE